jgi:hypothetical protein
VLALQQVRKDTHRGFTGIFTVLLKRISISLEGHRIEGVRRFQALRKSRLFSIARECATIGRASE